MSDTEICRLGKRSSTTEIEQLRVDLAEGERILVEGERARRELLRKNETIRQELEEREMTRADLVAENKHLKQRIRNLEAQISEHSVKATRSKPCAPIDVWDHL